MTEPLPEPRSRPPGELTVRELATVLAALRFWQDEMGPHPHAGCYPEHLADILPLDSDEIDALCERLNEQETAHGS